MEKLNNYLAKECWRRDLHQTYEHVNRFYSSAESQYETGMLLTGGWALSALSTLVCDSPRSLLISTGLTAFFLLTESLNTSALKMRVAD